jgi:hypothetical protein
MIKQIQNGDYELLKNKFIESISFYPLINSVLSNIQDGFVYSNKSLDVLVVVTKSGFSYVKMVNNTEENFELIFKFLQNNKEIPNYIHLYEPNELFLEYIKNNWDKYKVRDRIQYRYSNRNHENIEDLLPQNYSWDYIQNISPDKLNVFELDLDKRYWNSIEDFRNYAIGACILDENKNPSAICYSACVVDNIAEMDTLVLNNHRGKGFMRIVSLPFFNIANEKNYITHWDTFVSNTASYIMGEKFEPDTRKEYQFLSILLK